MMKQNIMMNNKLFTENVFFKQMKRVTDKAKSPLGFEVILK